MEMGTGPESLSVREQCVSRTECEDFEKRTCPWWFSIQHRQRRGGKRREEHHRGTGDLECGDHAE